MSPFLFKKVAKNIGHDNNTPRSQIGAINIRHLRRPFTLKHDFTLIEDHISPLLCDHIDGSIGITTDDPGHDRSIDDPEALYTIDL